MHKIVLARSSSVVALSLLACATMCGQTGPTGTWRVDGDGPPFPWEVALRTDGPRLIGVVKTCTSNGPRDISDGAVDGDTISFKCVSGDGRRTISFKGEIIAESITFTWAMQVSTTGVRDPRPDGMFGSSAPTRFIAKRVPDGELAKRLDVARGMDFAAAINVIPKDLKAEGALFLPQKVTRARAVLVVINYGLGFQLSVDPQSRKLAENLGAALLGVRFSGISRTEGGFAGESDDKARPELLVSLLQQLARESLHPELVDAPMLFWGHSGAAVAATTFAGQFPARTIAFIRYHSGSAPAAELGAVSKIPGLLLSGGKEFNPSNAPSTEAFWKRGRAQGAPWTFAIEPNATHGDFEDLKKANALIIPWITAVFQQRLPPDGTSLRAIPDTSGWIGDNKTGEVAPYRLFTGAKAQASWLPDEASARAWQNIREGK